MIQRHRCALRTQEEGLAAAGQQLSRIRHLIAPPPFFSPIGCRTRELVRYRPRRHPCQASSLPNSTQRLAEVLGADTCIAIKSFRYC